MSDPSPSPYMTVKDAAAYLHLNEKKFTNSPVMAICLPPRSPGNGYFHESSSINGYWNPVIMAYSVTDCCLPAVMIHY